MRPLDRINGYAHVALRYGLEEAIFLDSVMFWYKENRANGRNFYEGRWWTYNSVAAFAELLPWWTGKQLRRIISSCKEKGALLSENYSEDRRDRTVWYTPSDELLELYGMAQPGDCICPNGQTCEPERANEPAQTGKCNIEHVETHVDPPIAPQAKGPDWTLFDSFWEAYPRKKNKEAARRAWKQINPDMELCRVMAAGLKRDKRSPGWQEEDGRFIPYPASWLRGRRWEDEDEAPPPLRGEGVEYL